MNKRNLTCVPATDPLPAEWTTLVSSDEAETIAESVRARGSSSFRTMQLLPFARRQAAYAVYEFCREVDDISPTVRRRGRSSSLFYRTGARKSGAFTRVGLAISRRVV